MSVRLCLADWRWSRGQKQREEYVSILNAFIDKKDSYYSIHQIGELAGVAASGRLAVTRQRSRSALLAAAQMGVGEGKPIGQWYGPNTVAQVLK